MSETLRLDPDPDVVKRLAAAVAKFMVAQGRAVELIDGVILFDRSTLQRSKIIMTPDGRVGFVTA
jgi:hypothetical protein